MKIPRPNSWILTTRITKVHRVACKHCPSAHFPPDPESLDVEQWVKEGKVDVKDAVFPCAWRPGRLCKGICDQMGYVP